MSKCKAAIRAHFIIIYAGWYINIKLFIPSGHMVVVGRGGGGGGGGGWVDLKLLQNLLQFS